MTVNYNEPPNFMPRKPQKSRPVLEVVLIVLLFIGVVVAAYALQGWVAMLFLGAIHLQLWNKVPPFSFVASVLLAVMVNAFVLIARSVVHK